ncbi:hypothetical protein H5T87_06565 [bacterium]|nr:hypothetical protein [bacterium]
MIMKGILPFLCLSFLFPFAFSEEIVFDGQSISAPHLTDFSEEKQACQLSTDDGLLISLSTKGAVLDVKEKGKVFGRKAKFLTGFFLKDYRTDSIVPLKGDIKQINIKKLIFNSVSKDEKIYLEAIYEAHSQFIKVKGTIKDLSGKDRAITLYYALPVSAKGWLWWDDIASRRRVSGEEEYIFAEDNCPFGAQGKHSRYFLATLSHRDRAISLAIPMDKPVIHRLAYNPSTQSFYIAFDFALVKDTLKSPSSATFEFLIYTADPEWGFRSALQKYYEIFPQFFLKRVKKEGGWYVWGNMKDTPEAKEAGFMFHWGPGGVDAVHYDNQAGFYALQYIECALYQESLGDFKEAPPYEEALRRLELAGRSDEATLALLDKLSYTGGSGLFGQMPRKEYFQRISKAVLNSLLWDENDKPICLIGNFPWIGDSGWGAIFPCNLDPDIPDGYGRFDMDSSLKSAFEFYESHNAHLNGIALDSYGGYGDDKRINYRREHFKYADFPLTFSLKDRRPVIPQYFSIIEWTRELSRRVHPKGLILMANCAWGHAPAFLIFAAPYLDVFGAEAPYQPDPRFIRTIAYHKPCTDLPYSPRPEWELKFHLLYGIFPGHGNDLNLMKKYNPFLQALTKAGWEPITYAYTDNENILIERFGRGKELYFSIHNQSDENQKFSLSIELEKLGLRNVKITNFLSGENLKAKKENGNLKIEFYLTSKDTVVIKLEEVKDMKPLYLERFKYPRLILEPTGRDGDSDSQLVDCFKVVLDYDKGPGELFQKDGYYYAIYTGFDGQSYRCGLLKSKDLLNWEKVGMILDTGKEGDFDAGSAGGGVAFRWKGKFYMVYTGYPFKGYENGPGKIGLCISDDLMNWKKLGIILEPDGKIPWEAGGLYQPFPLIAGGKFYLFYNAKDAQTNWIEQTGLAICKDAELLKWEKLPENPILKVGEPGAWDSRFASDPWVIPIAGKWHMFYYGFDGIHAQDGVAVSKDLLHWEKSPFNPILPYGEPGSYDEEHAHKPCVVLKAGIYYHFYTAVGSKGRCIALATSVPLVQEEDVQ